MNNKQQYSTDYTGVIQQCPGCRQPNVYSTTGFFCDMGCFYGTRKKTKHDPLKTARPKNLLEIILARGIQGESI